MFNRLGQAVSLLADLPTAPKKKRRTPAPAPFPQPDSAIERARRQAATAHHHAIEVAVEEAQQRWLAEQEGGTDAEQ